ncbi:MAG: endopeptidase La [Saprospiraceae bacterium]
MMEENEYHEVEETSNKPLPAGKVLPSNLNIIPLFKRPIFPGIVIPMLIDRKEDIESVQNALDKDNGNIGLVYVKDQQEDEIDYYDMGTIFHAFRSNPLPNGNLQILGQAVKRFKKKRVSLVVPRLRWEVTYHDDPQDKPNTELKAYMLAISTQVKELLQLNPTFKEQVNQLVSQLNYDTPGLTMDLISNLLTTDSDDLQALLEKLDLQERAQFLMELLREEYEVAKIQQKINDQINEKVQQQQREFFLREQLNAIKKELGLEKDETENEVEQLQEKLSGKKLPPEAQKVVDEEIQKMQVLNPQSPEYNVTRNYLSLIADLPWGVFSKDSVDIKKARRILDRDHYGLQDVKDRILEYLSTIIKRGRIGGSIICLVGPPGVGKTSIGKSIASALNRKFFRFSVGGMRDEAEIKGHRRTYIGAMPGKIIQSLKRVETANPVIMLDEIDKIGMSFQGDPASALLEVLDPEQNQEFLDHYLDIPFDLSNVLFVTTANQLDTIPGPLQDRMEVIRLSGYIMEEKVEIARKYLVPKQLEAHGFKRNEITFTKTALKYIIDNYAREAGVRNLEKHIRRIIRKATLALAEGQEADLHIDKEDVEKFLGKPIFHTEQLYDKPIPGVVLGLAYTSYGGATLYIEAAAIKSARSGFKQTGQLGSVMQESSEIAYSYVRSVISHDERYAKFFDENFIHLHVPAGATPKDGPSAGVTMALALYSLAVNKAVKPGIAMTGELSLTGKVLPIGGVQEKSIAAKRVGIKELIFPFENKNDFDTLPDYVKKGLKVHFIKNFGELLGIAYRGMPPVADA